MSYVFGFALEKKTLRFKLLKVQLVDMYEGSHLLVKRPIFDICCSRVGYKVILLGNIKLRNENNDQSFRYLQSLGIF